MKQYHGFVIKEDDKELTYKICKIGAKDAFWVIAEISNITAAPILSLLIDIMFGENKDKVEKAKEKLESLLSAKDSLKENIGDLIKIIRNNFEEVYKIGEILMDDIIVEEKLKDGTIREKKISFVKDFNFDDLDLWLEIFINSIRVNYEVGFKKAVKKFLYLVSEMNSKIQSD